MVTITQQMHAIDTKNRKMWDKLTDKERNMWLTMRWTSATKSPVKEINEYYLTMTNSLVNVHFNDLRHHPELQYLLLQVVGIGTKQRHDWIPPGKKGKTTHNKKFLNLLMNNNPLWNEEEAMMFLNGMSPAEKEQYLVDNGIDRTKDFLK